MLIFALKVLSLECLTRNLGHQSAEGTHFLNLQSAENDLKSGTYLLTRGRVVVSILEAQVDLPRPFLFYFNK